MFVIAGSSEARSKAIREPNNNADEIIKSILNGQYLHRYNLSYLILTMMPAQIAALRL